MRANIFCDEADIKNEAGVEMFFVMRMLKDIFGYKDKNIRAKETIDSLSVSSGRKRVLYRPDFAITMNGHVRWICDAKSPSEKLDGWQGQCRSYCHELNARYGSGENPVKYYMLTNGKETKVYSWDSNRALITLLFEDFALESPKLIRLKGLLGADSEAFLENPEAQSQVLIVRRKSANELNADFAWCHDQIHKKDALSYTAAFMEFVKLIFLKLISDKELHESRPEFREDGAEALQVLDPARNVRFSVARILAAEAAGVESPMSVEFDRLRENLELQIKQQNKKRIFKEHEKLGLSKELIRDIVRRLEATDLYGLDADLNGRLFETFLNATLRGKSLGQYFTPRSVVKLAVSMADIQVSSKVGACDVVIDGCCGSGGFLIEALAEMWRKVDGSNSIGANGKIRLKDQIANHCIYGVDSAKDPALARIARMNMYLHGDGGSAIYQLDALDKTLAGEGITSAEARSELHDFKKLLSENPEGFATIALTNPPFARDYERKAKPGSKVFKPSILDSYELSYEGGGDSKPRTKLKSSAMFLERYLDFMKPGGRLITVIDDSVLASRGFLSTRQWLKSKYIIEAVVSLPGDAFQRSEARVKTSLLILRKKTDSSDVQGDVFMYYSQFVGVDDPSRERVLPIDEDNHRAALQEIETIGGLFGAFRSTTGRGSALVKPWVVAPSALDVRWDVKACLLRPGRLVGKWRKAKLKVVKLSTLVQPIFVDGKAVISNISEADVSNRTIRPRIDPKCRIVHLRMTYRGKAERGEEKYSGDSDASVLFRVAPGDIVISHINALHGAVGIVPPELEGSVVTSEYTVLRPKDGVDARILCELLRSPDLRSDIILTSTGIGRTRATWKELADLLVPVPSKSDIAALSKLHDELDSLTHRLTSITSKAEKELNRVCKLGDKGSCGILQAFKPPQ